MKYIDYEELIIQKYGIELQGWTFEKFACPGSLSTSIPGLQELLDAINNGKCCFVKLTALELKKRCEERQKQVGTGTVAVKKRKRHSDIGTKKPQKKAGNGNDDGVENDTDKEERLRKCRAPKSAETIDDEDN